MLMTNQGLKKDCQIWQSDEGTGAACVKLCGWELDCGGSPGENGNEEEEKSRD